MAQTAPSADAPLPRPGRFSPSPRAARPPRLTAIDAAWMGFLALLAFVISLFFSHTGTWAIISACLSAATVKLLYLYGWRARDRAAGVIAALLAATSLPFLSHGIAAPLDALFVVLSAAALFAFLAGSSLLALVLAGFATAARPDGILLGLVLMVLALAQGRRRAPLGVGLFFVAAAVAWLTRSGLGHNTLPSPHIGPRPWLLTWAVTSGTVFISWLLVPFCAELGDPVRRARWLPILAWTIVYIAVESFVRPTSLAGAVYGLAPLWFALAGGGLSRLLPAVTGDLPLPWIRYGLATIAVLAMVGIRLKADLFPPPVRAIAPHRIAPSQPAAPPPVKPAPIVLHATAHVPVPAPSKAQTPAPHPAATPKAPAKSPVKPATAPPPHAAPKAVPAHPFYRARHPYAHYYRARRSYWRGR